MCLRLGESPRVIVNETRKAQRSLLFVRLCSRPRIYKFSPCYPSSWSLGEVKRDRETKEEEAGARATGLNHKREGRGAAARQTPWKVNVAEPTFSPDTRHIVAQCSPRITSAARVASARTYFRASFELDAFVFDWCRSFEKITRTIFVNSVEKNIR